MNCVLLYITAFALMAVARAVSLTSFATVALTLLTLNEPAACFFSIFGRRNRKPEVVQEKQPVPEGPVSFPSPNFPNPQRSGFLSQFNPFNPFGMRGGGFLYPGFQNIPQFGFYGQNRVPQQVSQLQFPYRQQFDLQQQRQEMQNQVEQPVRDSNVDPYSDTRVENDESPSLNTEEAESFFTLLAETDESQCISRLVCEMGANPASGGEFGQTISEIIGSLTDFPVGSQVSYYNQVLQNGRNQGLSACVSKYSSCDEETFHLVKQAQSENADSQ